MSLDHTLSAFLKGDRWIIVVHVIDCSMHPQVIRDESEWYLPLPFWLKERTVETEKCHMQKARQFIFHILFCIFVLLKSIW